MTSEEEKERKIRENIIYKIRLTFQGWSFDPDTNEASKELVDELVKEELEKLKKAKK